ncbi:tol-pal system protein YbgF [Psychromonas sp.]|uniref:tol-pal system protein YbgF n=1 Tax=Psychromonas sp. TaxID=1884585 RepID=UPI0035648A39
MNKINLQVAIIMAAFLSTPVFAAAPVTDVTSSGSSGDIAKQLEHFSRLLESRNKMQIRMQNQLSELSSELREIKGNMELFDHKITQIENRQRNLYQMIEESNSAASPAATTKTAPPAVSEGEQSAYQKAVDLVLVDKDYSQAITAFEAFIIDYPQSEYLANSHYWLGQLLYQQGKREEARIAFLTVSDKFPKSGKRADSLYKIGIIDEYLGELGTAENFYQRVLKDYPNSSAAGLAQKRLNTLSR